MNTKTNTGRRSIALLSVIALACLSACTTMNQKAKDEAVTANDSAARVIDRVMSPAKLPRVTDSDDIYVNTTSVRVRDDAELLPAMFRMPVRLQMNPRCSLKDLVAQLSRVSGLRFAFAQDLIEEVSKPTLNNGFTTEQSLKDLLDAQTSQANLSWRFREGSVDIFRYDTKVFQVASLPGITDSSTTVSSKNAQQGGGNASQASLSGQEFKVASKADFWASTAADLGQMITKGGKFSIAQSMGTVTATDTPQALNVIETYIKQVNFLRSRNVNILIRVYDVTTTAGQNFDLNLQAALSKLGKYGATIGSAGAATPLAGAIQIGGVIKNPNSALNGSTEALTLLGSIGHTSEVDRFSANTTTGEPAPVTGLTSQSYLAKVTVTPATVVGASPSTSLEAGTVTFGTAGTLTPTVINGSEMLLRVALDLSSSTIAASPASSDGSYIQLPTTVSHSVVQNLNISSGDTLLFGFQTKTASYASSSIADPELDVTLLAGGSRASKTLVHTLVYAITPTISESH